jgi:hypothetical protein
MAKGVFVMLLSEGTWGGNLDLPDGPWIEWHALLEDTERDVPHEDSDGKMELRDSMMLTLKTRVTWSQAKEWVQQPAEVGKGKL